VRYLRKKYKIVDDYIAINSQRQAL